MYHVLIISQKSLVSIVRKKGDVNIHNAILKCFHNSGKASSKAGSRSKDLSHHSLLRYRLRHIHIHIFFYISSISSVSNSNHQVLIKDFSSQRLDRKIKTYCSTCDENKSSSRVEPIKPIGNWVS